MVTITNPDWQGITDVNKADTGERLTDAEISRIKREGIDRADDAKQPGKSRLYDEMIDRDRVSTRKSFFFKIPWK